MKTEKIEIMTTEEFLKDVCPNHTDKSRWNKSELLHILKLHTEQLRKHAVSGRSEQLVCPICGNKRCPHASDHNYECTNSNDVGQNVSNCTTCKFTDAIYENEKCCKCDRTYSMWEQR